MRLVAYGGDKRMEGACQAAERAGWETRRIVRETELSQAGESADIVLLPWPKSFLGDQLMNAQPGETISRVALMENLPRCGLLAHGAGFSEKETDRAGECFNPAQDEGFLMKNALLTAEGAVYLAMLARRGPLLGACCLVTGYGRIGRGLTLRLVAMGAFVIVCARSEEQMQKAHADGAHPIPPSGLVEAAGQADFLFNTVPARIMGAEVLEKIRPEATLMELASAPFGFDREDAVRRGIRAQIESGLPGRYAPSASGQALFQAAVSRWMEEERE